MVAAVGFKIIASRHHLHTRFYENLPVGSKDTSADPLCLKPTMPLGRFCHTVNNYLWFPWLYHCLYVGFALQ
jgi:hypothetical protein